MYATASLEDLSHCHHPDWVSSKQEREENAPSNPLLVQKPVLDVCLALLTVNITSRSYRSHHFFFIRLLALVLRSPGTMRCALLESVAEPAGDGLEVSRASGAGGLPPLGLLAPVDYIVLISWSSFMLNAGISGRRTLAGLSSRVSA